MVRFHQAAPVLMWALAIARVGLRAGPGRGIAGRHALR
nr:MAG TPA: hypothetical protein [Caudoviricetes sp.]